MKYTDPPLAAFKEKDIVLPRWGDMFDKEDEIIIIPLPYALCTMGINIWYDSNEELSLMKKMCYDPRTGLGKKKNGVSKLPDFKGQTTFIFKGLSKYQGQPKEW